MTQIDSDDVASRMRAAVSLAWKVFARKVGGGLIPINKEASMQMQYAYVLQQLIPVITFHDSEDFKIELETGARVDGTLREIDLLFEGKSDSGTHLIAVEMKCYRTLAASGKPRGATDIWMKDVYFDFYLLERYVALGIANEGVSLLMNDRAAYVNPKNKDKKCWDYDISDGAVFGEERYTTPIGGNEIDFELGLAYRLTWEKHGDFWFSEIQGRSGVH